MCLSGDYRVTWGPRISTRMDKQERSVRERQGPNPSWGHVASPSPETSLRSSLGLFL